MGELIQGDAGNNNLVGTSGDDTLKGLGGIDTLSGGAGNDVYYVDNAKDVLIENPDSGIDLVYFSDQSQNSTFVLPENVERLILQTGSTNGTGNASDNYIKGNEGPNVLKGLDGNDTLDSGGGWDTLIGGDGNDTYYLTKNNAITVIEESGAAAGTSDTVVYTADSYADKYLTPRSYTLAENVENLYLNGTVPINVVGNILDNLIVGNDQSNELNGLGGIDTLIGGAGNDVYVVDSLLDVVIESGNDQYDVIRFNGKQGETYVLPLAIERIILDGSAATNATGNALANSIEGNDANNVLDGGAGDDTIAGGGGADTLIGGEGNDTYYVDSSDVIIETGDDDADSVVFSGAAGQSYVLPDGIENLSLRDDFPASNATGNAADNIIQGNSYANVLDGGLGADTLIGLDGNDVYIVDTTTDVIRELSGGGRDEVDFTGTVGMTLTLSANVESLYLLGSAATNGTGNATANTIVGNAAANVLKGGDGVDNITGGAGADTLCGNTNSKTDDKDSDHFIYLSIDDSGTTTSTRDTIWGYFNGKSQTADKIDLSAVETGSALDHFAFIGSAAFGTNRPGEVRVIKSGSDYIVQVNTDADNAPEMTILVHSNSHTFVAADFIL